ncbi:hypothetical protein EDC17_101852 [Sphingobacterium alimentarium]|uniref:Uncharacterized protein n=1 Tax=Sphingobacterium alimentarium TaxID=797292 RepID=A0A4R3VW97_9SPHI|nr:hypothetical protein [Sphingobacterium alimentarium]TCV14034.1 hypothetical protein EDC17_101852 [Sphingobacterium alimentarium]
MSNYTVIDFNDIPTDYLPKENFTLMRNDFVDLTIIENYFEKTIDTSGKSKCLQAFDIKEKFTTLVFNHKFKSFAISNFDDIKRQGYFLLIDIENNRFKFEDLNNVIYEGFLKKYF